MVLEYRLPRIAALQGRYTILDRAAVSADVGQIRSLLPPVGNAMAPVKQADFADSDESEVIAWLEGLALQGPVRALWPSRKEGIELSFADFARNYSDLWYPGSDDVWVIPPAMDWVLELYHEEIFSLYRPTV